MNIDAIINISKFVFVGFVVIYGMKKLFLSYCKDCNMYSFAGDKHCCFCKHNYVHIIADEGYFEVYEHCCGCKQVYNEGSGHLCNAKSE